MLAKLDYVRPEHRGLPHFLNMSGGRSSAALAIELAETGQLNKTRGDAVIFCNTSAEHPNTYRFAAKVSDEIEEYDIPVFWMEYSTVEKKTRGGKYMRGNGWRLVNRQPHTTDNPFGFRSDGSVFEELISYKFMVPSQHTRMCTQYMKVGVATSHAAQWMTGSHSTLPQGHNNSRQITAADRASTYKGRIFADPMEAEPVFRKAFDEGAVQIPSQRWQDYTTVDLSHRTKQPKKINLLRVTPTASHTRLLGLRHDEKARVDRIVERLLFNQGCGNSKYPPGENLYTPLYDAGTTKKHIMEWWSRHHYDLDIPYWAGNCTYCFMKGPSVIAIGAASEQEHKTIPDTSTPLDWWIRMEQQYAAPSELYDRNFGWLGQNKASYQEVLQEGGLAQTLGFEDMLPCDCTD